jgi:4,5-dihydroxyphthalate decarboxylase
MHVIVLKETIYRRNTWIAQSLFKSFEEAKKKVYQRQYDTSALNFTIPWIINEIEETRELMGYDFWPYGFQANEKALEKLVDYLWKQGMLKNKIEITTLFPKETMDIYKI